MSRLFNGSQYLYNTAPVWNSTWPLTISAWVKDDGSLATNAVAASFGHTSSTNNVGLGARSSGATRIARLKIDTGSETDEFYGSTNLLPSAFKHLACICEYSKRTLFTNGGNKQTSLSFITDFVTDSNIFAIGSFIRGGSYITGWAGKIAEVAVWNDVLTEFQISSLASGMIPTAINPTKLIKYYTLRGSDLTNIVNPVAGQDLTNTGSTEDAEHPTIYTPVQSMRGLPLSRRGLNGLLLP